MADAKTEKHIVLQVPDYNRTGGSSKAPQSYLRLGSAGTGSPGDDLFDMAQDAVEKYLIDAPAWIAKLEAAVNAVFDKIRDELTALKNQAARSLYRSPRAIARIEALQDLLDQLKNQRTTVIDALPTADDLESDQDGAIADLESTKSQLDDIPGQYQSEVDESKSAAALSAADTALDAAISITGRLRDDELFFKDDQRYGEGRQDPETEYVRMQASEHNNSGLNQEGVDPKDLTKELRTRGGWRDHTDGNRISTTRGDKVEVVRGNFSRIVFGRVTGPKVNEGLYESSGGHNYNRSSTPGYITSITWVEDELNGTWKVVEETERGDTLVKYSGILDETYYGPSIQRTIGKSGGTHHDNPQIEEITHAKLIYEDTHVDYDVTIDKTVGIADDDLIEISDDHYDESMDEDQPPMLSEDEWAEMTSGELKREDRGKTVEETIGTKTTPVSTFTDKMYAGTISLKEYFLIKSEFENGKSLDLKDGMSAYIHTGSETEFCLGASSNIFMGGRIDIALGSVQEVKIGPLFVDINIGKKASGHTSEKIECEIDDVGWELEDQEYSAVRKALGLVRLVSAIFDRIG